MSPNFPAATISRMVLKPWSADGLHPHLHHPSRALEGLLHPPRVVGIERHSLFLVNVLSGLDGGNEIQRVLVLWRSNQHRVDGFVVEHFAEILVGMDRGNDSLHFVQAPRIDIRHGYRFDIGALDGGVKDFLAAIPASNKTDSYAVVGSQHTAEWEDPRGGHRR